MRRPLRRPSNAPGRARCRATTPTGATHLATGSGRAPRELDLHGTVDFDELTTVLAGQIPRTGERLISARGSRGRVASLAAGTARSPSATRGAVLGWWLHGRWIAQRAPAR